MEEIKKADEEQYVSFDYPEGFKKAAQCLDFLPEDQREAFLMSMFGELILA